MSSLKISREPAVYLTVFATAVRFLAAFVIDLSDTQQAVLNAAATAIAGLVVAVWVRKGGVIPALLGAVQAVLALAVGFGADLSAEAQAVIMSVVGAAVAVFVRSQVTAPTPASPAITD